ncbi:MAG: flavin reductase family protein [Clostridium sp.]|nr:flavin reductase family protein [Clostridium sp.]
MAKQIWKPGNMLYPIPAALISVADKDGKPNLFTASWVGTVCSEPPMVSVSVRPERYSYHMIEETGEFVINLTTKKLARAADYCGVRSGRDENKWERAGLTPVKGTKVRAPYVKESPVNIECRVTNKLALGTHDMFIGTVEAVLVDDAYMDEKNTFHLEWAEPIVYSHGTYHGLGDAIGKFGFSVKKGS